MVRMMKRDFDIISKEIGLKHELIEKDLSKFYNIIYDKPLSAKNIIEEWGSVENFVDLLYWMKFVSRINTYQMTVLTGNDNISRYYKQLGWGFNTDDFDECNLLYDQYIINLKNIEASFDLNDEIFNDDKFLTITNNSRGKINKTALKYYGVKSEEELIRRLYYYLYIKELRTQDIATLMKVSVRAIEKMLNTLNIELSKSETQKRASRNRDYRQIYANMRQTMANSLEYDGMFGSRIENTIRTKISSELEAGLDENFAIIVGLNTLSIIPPYEVDIPVLILNKKSGRVYQIAIEIDGESYHGNENDSNDKKKNSLLIDSGWNILRIYIANRNNANKILNNEVEKCLDSIFEILDYKRKIKINTTSAKNNKDENISEKQCPLCKSKLVKRTAKYGPYKGQKFWGCSNYPNCKYIENIKNSYD